jgi:tripartite-type tricarboxylate transporter receptor subunit TctC
MPLRLAAASACLFAIVLPNAYAQAYPNRPIRIVEPFPAGGGGDFLLRVLATKLTAVFGQPIVIDNRPGSGGNIGAELAAKAPPDGYTLFNGTTVVLAPSRSMYSKLPYDVLKDFTPITRVGAGAYVLVVHPSLPVRAVKDLVALAKARPGQINYASAGGVGSGSHLCAELFKHRAAINLVHVPYKGGPPAVTAVVAGETETNFATVAS